jgi:hypothetical protein
MWWVFSYFFFARRFRSGDGHFWPAPEAEGSYLIYERKLTKQR